MSINVKSEFSDERIEFDIIKNGKYARRVTRGVLCENWGDTMVTSVCGDKRTLFGAAMALMVSISEHGWEDEFMEFSRKHFGGEEEND